MSHNCLICKSAFKNPKHLYTHIRNKHKNVIITVPKGALKDNINDKVIYSYADIDEIPTFKINKKLENEAIEINKKMENMINWIDNTYELTDNSEELKELIIDIRIAVLGQISKKTDLSFDYLIKNYL